MYEKASVFRSGETPRSLHSLHLRDGGMYVREMTVTNFHAGIAPLQETEAKTEEVQEVHEAQEAVPPPRVPLMRAAKNVMPKPVARLPCRESAASSSLGIWAPPEEETEGGERCSAADRDAGDSGGCGAGGWKAERQMIRPRSLGGQGGGGWTEGGGGSGGWKEGGGGRGTRKGLAASNDMPHLLSFG